MISYYSLKASKKLLSDWVTADPNLQYLGFGDPARQGQLNKQDQVYPQAWLVNTNSAPLERVTNRSFQILFCDIKSANENDLIEVMSDCEEYAFRLVRFLRNNDDFIVVGNPIIQPFEDKFIDDVAGVILDIVIQFEGDSNWCDDPGTSFNQSSQEID